MIYEGERERPIRMNLAPTPYCRALREAIPGLSEMGSAILLSAAETDRPRSYSRSKPHYAAMPKRHRCNYSHRKVTAGIANLEELGLLAEHDQRPAGTHNRGRQSTFRLDDDVRALAFGITGRRYVIPPRELLVMKDADGRLEDYHESRPVRIMRSELDDIREMMQTARVTGAEVGEAFRVFNNSSWDQGGRIYWPGQNAPKDGRHDWMIEDEPTVELDYVSIHPSLLYAERGLPIPADCYAIRGFEHQRLGLKIALATMINAKGEASAVTSIAASLENIERKGRGRKKLKRGDEVPGYQFSAARALVFALKREHAPIADAFYTGAGTRLQGIDARVALAVMAALMKRGIPVLPIHDSFRVQARHEGVLNDTMRECAVHVGRAALQVKRSER